MRFGLNRDLGFSERDRGENIRRIAEVGFLCCGRGMEGEDGGGGVQGKKAEGGMDGESAK